MIALFVALGGTTYAAVVLPKNSVKAKQIATNAVGASEIKSRAVGTSEVRNGRLLAEDFRAGQLPAGAKGDKGTRGSRGSRGSRASRATTPSRWTRSPVSTRMRGARWSPTMWARPPKTRVIVQADVVPGEGGAATGTTCFNLPSRPASAMVTLDNADAGAADRNLIASVAIDRGEDLGDCPATHNDARVRIVDGATEAAQNARFFIWFEL